MELWRERCGTIAPVISGLQKPQQARIVQLSKKSPAEPHFQPCEEMWNSTIPGKGAEIWHIVTARCTRSATHNDRKRDVESEQNAKLGQHRLHDTGMCLEVGQRCNALPRVVVDVCVEKRKLGGVCSKTDTVCSAGGCWKLLK